MRGRVALFLGVSLAASGCFSPSPPSGAPCSAEGTCPSGLICDTRLSPPLCVSSLDSLDGGIDGDSVPSDMAISCAADPDVCSGATPICDEGTCRGCDADMECASGACHELTGECIPEANVIFVSPLGSGSIDCTREVPCTLSQALLLLSPTRYFVALREGTHGSSVDFGGPVIDRTAIVSGPVRSPDATFVNTTSVNRILSGWNVTFEGFTLRGSQQDPAVEGIVVRGTATLSNMVVEDALDDAIEVDGQGRLTLLDSHVSGNAGTGVLASGRMLVIERSRIIGNGGIGIDVDDAEYSITNTMIMSNGALTEPTLGVRLRSFGGGGSNGMAVFRFNTVAANSGIGATGGVECTGPGANLVIDSTLFADNTALQVSASCDVTYSLFSSGLVPDGTGNLLGAADLISSTDGHIAATSAAVDKGNPMNPVPDDIDGQPRGALPDIGCDELP